ncbi:MAG TPA: rod shape-determining protein MreD [Geminicoccaceae bacterium]|nr:rod shape-determining protein MreD [Geminicoccaceae bacterium]
MTSSWLRRLDAWLRALVPLATALLAVVADVLPLLHVGPASVMPLATLSVAFFWSLYRPDLFGAGAAFATGLAHDALAGLPLGLTSLVLLLVRHVMAAQRRFFVARPFPVIWCCFVLLALAALALRWALCCLWWGRLFAPQPLVFELLLTLAFYPVATLLLARVHNWIPRTGDAS